jgi:N-acetylglucosaminyl-diphospho-decaprenol L-rhamnosyltransferase
MSSARADDMQSQIDVVIVNWNTGDCLRNCLRSLGVAAAGVRLGRTVVIDNASSDGSADHLPRLPNLILIHNEQNVGFAAACNQGARLGTAPYALFLNPDTVLLPETLRSVLAFMDGPNGTSYGICGASVLQPDGTPGLSASRFPTLANVVTSTVHLERVLPRLAPRHMLAYELQTSRPVDQVIGAFFLVRKSLFNRLEGFDERYFLYYEEVDFCRRAAFVGAATFFLSEAKVHHIGNVSAKRSGGRALLHSLRSRTVYAIRHWSAAEVTTLVAFTVMLELPIRLLRAVVRFNVAEVATVCRTFGGYVAFVIRIMRHRHPMFDPPSESLAQLSAVGKAGAVVGPR